MAQTNDTIDGLLAEFRGYAAGMPPSYHVTMSWADFRKMLDRFDAAYKRERGNAAKLREAIDYLCERMADMDATFDPSEVECLRAALAAPPRNCDVGTVGEQRKRFTAFCYKNRNAESCCGDCPVYKQAPRSAECELTWAQMPYEEKEGDAK